MCRCVLRSRPKEPGSTAPPRTTGTLSNGLLIQAKRKYQYQYQYQSGETSVQDARYLRSQAELCLQMARGMRDDKVAENLRAAATQYFVRALEVERPPEPLG
jgi:hypothetical protein